MSRVIAGGNDLGGTSPQAYLMDALAPSGSGGGLFFGGVCFGADFAVLGSLAPSGSGGGLFFGDSRTNGVLGSSAGSGGGRSFGGGRTNGSRTEHAFGANPLKLDFMHGG